MDWVQISSMVQVIAKGYDQLVHNRSDKKRKERARTQGGVGGKRMSNPLLKYLSTAQYWYVSYCSRNWDCQ